MRRFLSLVLALYAFSAYAAPVTLLFSPQWTEASEAQKAALPKDKRVEIVDFSLSSQYKGYALTVYTPDVGEINEATYAKLEAGFIQGITRTGQKLISKSPTTYRKYSGTWVYTQARTANGVMNSRSLLLCGENSFVTITLGKINGEIEERDPIIESYLSRLRFADSFKPGNTSKNVALTLGFIVIVAIAVGVAVLAVIKWKRRKANAASVA